MKGRLATLGKEIGTYGLGQIAAQALGILLLPIFTRYLSTADYGLIAQLQLAGMLISTLFGLGMIPAVSTHYFQHEKQQDRDSVIWSAFGALACGLGVLALLIAIFGPSVAERWLGGPDHLPLLWLTAGSYACILLYQPLQQRLKFRNKSLTMVGTQLAISLSIYGLCLFMVTVLGRGAAGYVEGLFLGNAAGLAIHLVIALKDSARITSSFNPRTAAALASFGKHLIPGSMLLYLLQQSNKYILEYQRGTEELGLYNFGFTIGIIMGMLVNAFGSSWIQFFMQYREKPDEGGEIFGRIMSYYVLGAGFINLMLFIFARSFVMIMATPSFEPSFVIIGFSALAQFFIGVTLVLQPGMYFHGEIRIMTLIQLGGVLVSLAANALLIPIFGIIGAGMGLAVGVASTVIFVLLWNGKRRSVYPSVQYQKARLARFALGATALAAASLAPRSLPLFQEISVACAGAFCAFALCWLLLETDERRALLAIPAKLVARG